MEELINKKQEIQELETQKEKLTNFKNKIEEEAKSFIDKESGFYQDKMEDVKAFEQRIAELDVALKGKRNEMGNMIKQEKGRMIEEINSKKKRIDETRKVPFEEKRNKVVELQAELQAYYQSKKIVEHKISVFEELANKTVSPVNEIHMENVKRLKNELAGIIEQCEKIEKEIEVFSVENSEQEFIKLSQEIAKIEKEFKYANLENFVKKEEKANEDKEKKENEELEEEVKIYEVKEDKTTEGQDEKLDEDKKKEDEELEEEIKIYEVKEDKTTEEQNKKIDEDKKKENEKLEKEIKEIVEGPTKKEKEEARKQQIVENISNYLDNKAMNEISDEYRNRKNNKRKLTLKDIIGKIKKFFGKIKEKITSIRDNYRLKKASTLMLSASEKENYAPYHAEDDRNKAAKNLAKATEDKRKNFLHDLAQDVDITTLQNAVDKYVNQKEEKRQIRGAKTEKFKKFVGDKAKFLNLKEKINEFNKARAQKRKIKYQNRIAKIDKQYEL